MLQIIRNNNPFTVIILFIYTLVVNLQVLFHPQVPVVPEGDFLFHIITGFLKVVMFNSPFGFTMLSVVMVALQGIYLNAVANRHKLFYKNTYIPAFVYISLCALYAQFGLFSQPLLVNWVLIMVIDAILQLAHTQKPRKLIYNTGFAIGVAALIQFPAIAYMLLFLFALSMLRNLNPGEWMVALLGCITPIYFAAGMLFLFDVLNWMPGWVNLGFNLPRSLDQPVYFVSVIAGVITLFVMGVYALQMHINKISIFVRRAWTALATALLVSILVALFTNFDIKTAWLVIMPPLALVIANAYYAEKNKAFSNFAFYFMLLLVIFCKMAGN